MLKRIITLDFNFRIDQVPKQITPNCTQTNEEWKKLELPERC